MRGRERHRASPFIRSRRPFGSPPLLVAARVVCLNAPMSFESRLNILRWRSIEEADTGGAVVSGERRREATSHAREGLTSASPGGAQIVESFLGRRARWLSEKLANAGSQAAGALGAMSVPRIPGSLLAGGWIAAIIGGFLLTGLGYEREINLLALPLVGLLLWNAVVMAASLVIEAAPLKNSPARAGWLARLLAARMAQGSAPAASTPGIARFHEQALPLATTHMNGRLRAWLHLAAALFAIGGALGMYAKGWSREYLAVWESTLLGESQAAAFFSALFGAASRVFGVALPLAELPGMHRLGGHAASPAPALPWIHLYAGTLALFVVLPRLLLAGLTLLRLRQREDRLWHSLGHESHARKLLRAIEGGSEHIEALLHDARLTEASRDRWTELIRRELGGQISVDFREIAGGDEDEFPASWHPASHTSVAVFSFATTPEEEVHGRLVRDLRARLRATIADGTLLVLLDAGNIRDRWTSEHRASHEALWRACLGDSGADVRLCE